MSGAGARPKAPQKRRAKAVEKPPPKRARAKPLRLAQPLDFDLAMKGLMAVADAKKRPSK